MPAFERYIGIDYSGAQTPSDSLPGLRVYQATRETSAREVPPPPSPRKYFTRREIAEWLLHELITGPPAIVGIDHAFSFPLQYFQEHKLRLDWPEFLADFTMHWPTDREHTYVCFVRDGLRGNGAARSGNSKWRRLTELRARTPKSVFHFDVPGSVATSTHAGLPWLFYLWQNRKHAEAAGRRIHFWPFDGWTPPANSSVIAEAYPALWNKSFPADGRTRDQQDAFAVAEWLRLADADGRLERSLNPQLGPLDRATAEIEGWILGVDMARVM